MDAFERNRRRLEENQRRLDALRMQNNKPASTERPKQSFFNKVRDQFDANTASDQYRRQQAGDARLYSQQQKDRGIGRVANNPWERTLNLGKSIGESVYATPKRLGQAVEEVVNGNKTQQSFNQLNQTNQKVLNKVNARLANPNLTPAERSIQEDIRQKMIRLQRQGYDDQRKEFSVAADKLDPKKNAAAVADAALTIASAGVAGVAMKTAGQTAAKLGYRAAARQAAPAFFKNMGLNTAQGVTDTVANIGEGRQASWKDIAKGGVVGATVGSVADVGLGLIPGVIGKRQYDKLLKDLASETDAGIVKQTVAAVNKNLPDEAVDNLSNDIAKAGTPDEVNKLLNEAADAEASVATKAVKNTVDTPTAPKPETPAIPNTAVTPEIVQGFKQAKTPQQARDAVKALFPELDETTANKVIQDLAQAKDDKTITQILEQAQTRRTAVTQGVQDVTPQAEAIAPTPEQQIAEVAQNQPTAQLTSKQAPDTDIQANQVTQRVDDTGTPVSAVQDAVDPLESLKQEATPKTVKVFIKSKFRDGGGYADLPVIRKVENKTLYQGGSEDGRQFWTENKKYAEQFGKVTKKTGAFYEVDNGNRMTTVYVDADNQATKSPKTERVAPVESKSDKGYKVNRPDLKGKLSAEDAMIQSGLDSGWGGLLGSGETDVAKLTPSEKAYLKKSAMGYMGAGDPVVIDRANYYVKSDTKPQAPVEKTEGVVPTETLSPDKLESMKEMMKLGMPESSAREVLSRPFIGDTEFNLMATRAKQSGVSSKKMEELTTKLKYGKPLDNADVTNLKKLSKHPELATMVGEKIKKIIDAKKNSVSNQSPTPPKTEGSIASALPKIYESDLAGLRNLKLSDELSAAEAKELGVTEEGFNKAKNIAIDYFNKVANAESSQEARRLTDEGLGKLSNLDDATEKIRYHLSSAEVIKRRELVDSGVEPSGVNPTNKPTQPPKSTPKTEAPDPLESLKQEARKYKSADTFAMNINDKEIGDNLVVYKTGGDLDMGGARGFDYLSLFSQKDMPKNTSSFSQDKFFARQYGDVTPYAVPKKDIMPKEQYSKLIGEATGVGDNSGTALRGMWRRSDKYPSVIPDVKKAGYKGFTDVNGDIVMFDRSSLTDLYNQTTAPNIQANQIASLTPEDLAAIQPKERINPTDATSQAPVRSLKEKPAKQTFEQVTKEYLGDTGAARIERQGTIADLQKRYKLSNDEKINAILAIDNPSVTPSSPQVAQFIEEYKQLTDSAYKAYTDSGIKMGYVDSYIPRIYKNKETGQLIDRVDYELLQQGTSRVKGREAEDVAVDWLVEKDPTKLLERYYDSMDRTVAGKAYLGKLQDNGLVVASSTSVPGLRPIVAEGLQAGDGMVYYAQKDVANKLNELFGSKEANNIVEAALDKAKGVNSLFQSVVLSGGVPNTPLNAFGVMQVLKEAMALHPVKAGKAMVAGMSKEFSDRLFTDKKDILKLMAQNDLDVRIDLTQTGLRGITRTKNAFKDQGVTGGINQAWNEFTNDATFGRFMPTLEVLHFENIYKAARKRGASIADASALAAESTKNFYGKTSVYKQAVRSKAVDDAAGAFLFAPRFRESMLNFWAKNAKAVAPQNWGKIAYRDNQKFLVASALTFAAMTQVNEALNGVQMWDNPDGKKDKLIIPADALDKLGINTNGKDVAIPFLPSLATVPRNIGMGAYNFATGKDGEGWKNVKSFTSIPISLGMDVATNEDYFGSKIVEDGATPVERRLQQGTYIAKNAMQPWIREGLNAAGQKLPESVKGKLGIKEKSAVEATSNTLELPFRFYNPKYYNYDKQFVPGGKEGEKFTFAEQRDRAKIGKEIKSIPGDLGLNKRQKAAYEKLNAVEFNDDGTLKEDSNPFYKVQRYSDLQDDKVFEAIKKRSELNAKLNGKPIDPIFDESVTPEQRRVLLWKKTLPPGTSDPTVKKLYEQDWYQDYQNKEDAYYDQKTAWNKQMGYKEPAQSTNPYPKATPELQSAMDYYFTLPKGTGARSNWIKGNGGLWNQMIGYWESKDAWTNGERAKVGLGNVDDEESGSANGKFGYNKKGGSGRGKGQIKKEATPKTYIGQLLGDVPSVSSNEINIKTTPKRAKLKVKTPSGKGRNYKKIKLG